MSILSITAPQFTREDERLEQETYTEEEVESTMRDLYGCPSSAETADDDYLDDDDRLTEDVLNEYYGTLDALEPEEKDAFLEAMERVPYLVEQESPPIDFLRAEGFNTWAAAERCVKYWELRVWLFGERAWLPMTSTGNGCLNEDDCRLLETGFCTLLDDDADKSGRGVLCFEVFERKLEFHRMAIVRVIFYLMSVAHERTSVQKNGLVVIADTKHYTTSHLDRKFIKIVAYLFMGYHPTITRAYHMCAPPGVKSCFLLVLPFIRYFQTRHIRQRFLVHTGTAPELAMDLEEYGIKKDSLPACLGGNRPESRFAKWLAKRREEEIAREMSLFGVMDAYDNAQNASDE
mmetsp:Transcript_14398/g.23325  ORF Transcript_14398/g.23325 Transcript_14398/m.23325 type:complete len:347 (-) Transcript_14398:1825-2865(-)